ncbi:MAG TPA: CHAT domain-containing tetratricopeptide repeat protein [Blastocatellia bacterium]|nr:CHAT domain-containing tetratricopeptide repeat protein [Blastocatellia bacterium]
MAQYSAKTRWRATIPLLAGVCLLIFSEPRPAAQTRQPQADASDPLPFGKAIERDLPKGEKHSYSFTLSSGQFVQAVVEQQGIDVTVAIFGTNGEQLTTVDRPTLSRGRETASLIAPRSGAYRLQIEAAKSGADPGRYRVILTEPRGAISSDEKRTEAEKLIFEAGNLWGKSTLDTLRQGAEKYLQASSLMHVAADPFEEGIALYGAGLCYRSLSANPLAIEAFSHALELMQEAKDDLGIAYVQMGLGWSYLYLGALDKALEAFKQSLQLRQRLKVGGEGRLYLGIGWVHIARNENQLALENFRDSLHMRQLAKDWKGATLARIGLGRAYARLEQYDESRKMLEQAVRELEDHGGKPDALWQLGWLSIRLKDYASAKVRFQEMLKLSLSPDDSDSDRFSEANARLGLAVCLRREGELSDALDHIKRGVEIIESLRTESSGSPRKVSDTEALRITYFAQVQEFYEVYIDLLMRLHEREPGGRHAAEALYISECARARNLLDLLARAGVNAPEQKVLAQPLRVDAIQRRALDENTVLLEYALGTAGPAETDRSFLWLVTRDSVESHLLPKRAEIEATAQRVYELLTARNHIVGSNRRERIAQADAQFLVEAKTLSRMLLGPVAAKLAGKRLLIAPQGVLQFIPFASLPTPESEGRGDGEMGRRGDGETERLRDRENSRTNFSPAFRPSVSPSLRLHVSPSPRLHVPPSPNRQASYTPLVANHEVVVVPSASALAEIVRQTGLRNPAERSVIVFADPVFSADDDRVSRNARRISSAPDEGKTREASPGITTIPQNLNRLSATDWEARQIASLAADSKVLLNFAAKLDTAIDPALGKYRFIHFATHALINPHDPDQSAIVLSQVNERGQPINGLLSAKQIHQLKLPVELVVLGACRTGLGKDVPGEGLMSLTRGFLSSGAARVMTSLWAVEDQATAEMMSRFYSRALGPKAMSPAAALRAAKVEMWRDGRWGPYYWGGFVLQGDWR